MMTKVFFRLFLLYVCCNSPIVAQQVAIENAEWLEGIWVNETSRGSIYESWSKVDGQQLVGKSYMIKDKDTVILETIRLVQHGDQVFYEPTIKTQNKGRAVRFNCTTLSPEKMTFENKKHDFPQYITYTKINTDSIVAEISGEVNNQMKKRSFPMRRVDE
ncbi:MAG: DUF6265 family protein [Bacteroidota bacterium]